MSNVFRVIKGIGNYNAKEITKNNGNENNCNEINYFPTLNSHLDLIGESGLTTEKELTTKKNFPSLNIKNMFHKHKIVRPEEETVENKSDDDINQTVEYRCGNQTAQIVIRGKNNKPLTESELKNIIKESGIKKEDFFIMLEFFVANQRLCIFRPVNPDSAKLMQGEYRIKENIEESKDEIPNIANFNDIDVIVDFNTNKLYHCNPNNEVVSVSLDTIKELGFQEVMTEENIKEWLNNTDRAVLKSIGIGSPKSAAAGKGMDVKMKSSISQPLVGFIPIHPAFSKTGFEAIGTTNQSKLDSIGKEISKFKKKSEHAIEHGQELIKQAEENMTSNVRAVVAIPFKINGEQIYGFTTENNLPYTSDNEIIFCTKRVINGESEFYSIDNTSDNVNIPNNFTPIPIEIAGYKISEIKKDDSGKDILTWTETRITADYDILSSGKKVVDTPPSEVFGSTDDQDNHMNINKHENLHKVQAEFGYVTDESRTLAEALNALLDTKNAVSHGPETSNPYPEKFTEANYPVFIPVIDKQECGIFECEVRILKNENDVVEIYNEFSSKVISGSRKFDLQVNPLWGWKMENGKFVIDDESRTSNFVQFNSNIATLNNKIESESDDNRINYLNKFKESYSKNFKMMMYCITYDLRNDLEDFKKINKSFIDTINDTSLNTEQMNRVMYLATEKAGVGTGAGNNFEENCFLTFEVRTKMGEIVFEDFENDNKPSNNNNKQRNSRMPFEKQNGSRNLQEPSKKDLQKLSKNVATLHKEREFV